jgi:hypothetical protein
MKRLVFAVALVMLAGCAAPSAPAAPAPPVRTLRELYALPRVTTLERGRTALVLVDLQDDGRRVHQDGARPVAA